MSPSDHDELQSMRGAADQAPGMLFRLEVLPDGTARMPYASAGIVELYGCDPAAARASAAPVLDRIVHEDRKRLLEPGAGNGPRRFRLRVIGADGSLHTHEVRATVRRDASGAHRWRGHVADVTRLCRLEEQAAQQAAGGAAAATPLEFLGRLSHEMRSPLTAILGFSSLLAGPRGGPLDDVQRQRVAMIADAGEQLLHLVDDVLDLTRGQAAGFSVSLAPTDAQSLIERCVALAAPVAGAAGVRLECEGGEGGRQDVLADRRRLEQVLANLISNAIKYNRPEGRVAVRSRRDGARLCIEVEDSGVGLDAGQRDSMFQPFNRLGAESTGVPGNGLGLVISRQLVEKMGGTLEVDSEPGVGSCFRVWLPLAGPEQRPVGGGAEVAPAPAPESVPPAATVAPASVAAASACRHVLYVDDNPVDGLIMQAVTSRRPDVVLNVAGSGEAAIEAALACPPALLLIDGNLRDMTGITLLRRLRMHPRLRSVPAVMVSADATPASINAATAEGFVDYWIKPMNLNQTLRSLDAVLAGGSTVGARAPAAPAAAPRRPETAQKPWPALGLPQLLRPNALMHALSRA